MNKSLKIFLKYLIEFLIVAFGVFLGIYASDWKNQKTIDQEKEKSINYIIDEMEINKEGLLKTIAYHELIKESFDSLSLTLSQADMSKPYFTNKNFNHQDIDGWVGLGLSNFEDIAFEGAKISGIMQAFDIESIQLISRVYKHQQFINEIGHSALDRMINLNFSSRTIDVLRILELITSDFLVSEKELVGRYESTIEKLRSNALSGSNR